MRTPKLNIGFSSLMLGSDFLRFQNIIEEELRHSIANFNNQGITPEKGDCIVIELTIAPGEKLNVRFEVEARFLLGKQTLEFALSQIL